MGCLFRGGANGLTNTAGIKRGLRPQSCPGRLRCLIQFHAGLPLPCGCSAADRPAATMRCVGSANHLDFMWIAALSGANSVFRATVVPRVRRRRGERAARQVGTYVSCSILAILGVRAAIAWGPWFGVAFWATALAFLSVERFRGHRKALRQIPPASADTSAPRGAREPPAPVPRPSLDEE